MALAKRVQPVHLARMDADGTFAVLQGRLRRGGRHVRLYVAPVQMASRHLRQGAGMARQVLHREQLGVQCRGRDTQHAARHHRLARAEGVGLHVLRLLPAHRLARQGGALLATRHQARDATQAACTRVLPARTDRGSTRQQGSGLRGVPQDTAPAPRLRTGVQRPHLHDGGDGARTSQEDDRQTEEHGARRQQCRLPGPDLLCHRQHIPGREGHHASYQCLRTRCGTRHTHWNGEGRTAPPPWRPLLAAREVQRCQALLRRSVGTA